MGDLGSGKIPQFVVDLSKNIKCVFCQSCVICESEYFRISRECCASATCKDHFEVEFWWIQNGTTAAIRQTVYKFVVNDTRYSVQIIIEPMGSVNWPKRIANISICNSVMNLAFECDPKYFAHISNDPKLLAKKIETIRLLT